MLRIEFRIFPRYAEITRLSNSTLCLWRHLLLLFLIKEGRTFRVHFEGSFILATHSFEGQHLKKNLQGLEVTDNLTRGCVFRGQRTVNKSWLIDWGLPCTDGHNHWMTCQSVIIQWKILLIEKGHSTNDERATPYSLFSNPVRIWFNLSTIAEQNKQQ